LNYLRCLCAGVAAAVVVVLSGCGVGQVQPASTPTVATPTPVPTIALQPGSVAARINGQAVPMPLFKRFLAYESAQGLTGSDHTKIHDAVETFTQFDVVFQYAQQHNMSATSTSIAANVKNIGSQLSSAGFTSTDIKYFATVLSDRTVLSQKLFKPVTSGPIAHARHILIAPGQDRCLKKKITKAQARQFAVKLLGEIQSGKKSFGKLAKNCSEDSGSSKSGGVVTEELTQPTASAPTGSTTLYDIGAFVGAFDRAVFHGPIHKLQLVHSQYGYHIIEVTSRHNGPYPKSVQGLARQDDLSKWIAAEVKKAKVVTLAKVATSK
jgi:parvulin-like peptidyl-prolyl isomerase